VNEEQCNDAAPALEARLAAMQDTMASLGRAVEGHSAWLTDLQRWVSSCANAMVLYGAEASRGPSAAIETGPDLMGRVLTWTEIQTVMSWIKNVAEIEDGPLVSVNIATRNRPKLLERAMASVLGQSYRHLELIVVDDSDGTETADLLDGIDDPRVRRLRTPTRGGPCPAYNLGLDSARGELIAFLDDDNVMHPEWLRSIVWAFAQRPNTYALYGARIVEDLWSVGTERTEFEGFPVFQFARYDRRRHERSSSIDRNVLAIRADGPPVRYDPHMRFAVDWEYTLRLFAQTRPLALPVIACYYGTSGPNRITETPRMEELRRIQSRAHHGRPLHVHAHCAGADPPALTADVEALLEAGTRVSLSADAPLPSVDGAGPWRLDVELAIEDAKPDLLLLDSASTATALADKLAAEELPFALTSSNTPASGAADPHWLGALDDGELEPALRQALTRWLYEQRADWVQA
jgi:Glycosyl transferase family 2